MPPPPIIVPDPQKGCQEASRHPSASVGVEDTQDAEEALQMPEDLGEDLAEEDFAVDEEAAAFMRGA